MKILSITFKGFKIKPINMADFSLVYIDNKTKTPHCIKHGAMNKVSNHGNQKGYWRCISVISNNKEGICRAGCEQI